LKLSRSSGVRSPKDARRATAAATTGDSLVVFPEGTFRRAAGLLPFRLGAFAMASRANLPVIPMALRGSRSVLRAEQWLPRRGFVTVTAGEPLQPKGTSFADAVSLRDHARAWMLAHVNEPDLA